MLPRLLAACGVATIVALSPASAADSNPTAKPWPRHTIDNSSRGADGVRLADANGDGRLDIVTGWEEGGLVRVYLNPGPAKAKQPWPAVTVGQVQSPEDAVFVDLDGDGALDVVSSCEGGTKTMYVHWAPKGKADYLDAKAWKTEPIQATQGQQMWMYCLPMQVDGRHGVDLVVGSKGNSACVGWLEAPAQGNERDLSAWKLHRIRDAGWIMSLIATDIDGDGQDDVLLSDRKGKASGVYWLRLTDRTKAAEATAWREHPIGGAGEEVMFIARDTLHPQVRCEIFAPVKPNVIRYFHSQDPAQGDWMSDQVKLDLRSFGNVKAVRSGNLTGGPAADWVVTCEGAEGGKSGVFMVTGGAGALPSRIVDIAGAEGVKYDRIELIDLDGDGNLDVLTCEERDNLGVIWYENPTIARSQLK